MAAKVTTWYLARKRMLMLRNSRHSMAIVAPSLLRTVNIGLFDGATEKLRTLGKNHRRRIRHAARRRHLTGGSWSFTLYSSLVFLTVLNHQTLQHICPAIYSFLLSRSSFRRPAFIVQSRTFRAFVPRARARIRKDEEALRRGTRWRVRETGKQKSEGESKRKRRRENVRKIDCENFRNIAFCRNTCTRWMRDNICDCRSRGKCFQGKYWILSKTDWLKSQKQIFFIVFENSHERSITCALVFALISSRESFRAQRVHCVEIPVEKYFTFNTRCFIFHQEMRKARFPSSAGAYQIFLMRNNFARVETRRAVIRVERYHNASSRV